MIPGLGSLRSRIFLASTVLATASIGSAVYFVSALLTAQAEDELRRDLSEAVSLVDQQSALRFDGVRRTATLIADLPKFKAALETRDPPTIAPIARDYLEQSGADLVVVTGRDGRQLAYAIAGGHDADAAAGEGGTPQMAQLGSSFRQHADGVLQLVTVPVTIDLESPERLGMLTLGYLLDSARARELRNLTGADVAFALDGVVRAASFPAGSIPAVTAWFASNPRPPVLRLIGDDYSALASPLTRQSGVEDMPTTQPHTIVLRSRTERMRTLATIRAAMGAVALATVALAAVLSYSLARTVTRPLATITAHMREAAATGDLTRRMTLPDSAWADEDALLVASTFNTLTQSVAAAQRDAAQRERLSALGRLSTVIAHEIRNPLMIIKGALRQLGRPGAGPDDTREAAHDIDEEVDRLNRVVHEVLDFARPIRFSFARASVNDICRSAREAVVAADPAPDVGLDLDPACGELTTDAERVRTVLVNLLTNARAAVEARPSGDAPPVVLSSRRHGGRVLLAVRDSGAGIPADDVGRIFDPYFTTRRTGSGLGLAIAKNVVEGLGGVIRVSSRVDAGTEMTVELVDGPAERRGSS
ncbi:MAG: ATP-binding protein [Vicinamibacterales bacterium]